MSNRETHRTLALRKETLRRLQDLTVDELQEAAGGGMGRYTTACKTYIGCVRTK